MFWTLCGWNGLPCGLDRGHVGHVIVAGGSCPRKTIGSKQRKQTQGGWVGCTRAMTPIDGCGLAAVFFVPLFPPHRGIASCYVSRAGFVSAWGISVRQCLVVFFRFYLSFLGSEREVRGRLFIRPM